MWRLNIKTQSEYFINYSQTTNPINNILSSTSSDDAATANNNYAALLMFIQQNPQKSAKFIMDIKQKFFRQTCEVKDDIDFTNISQMPNGMLFS